MRCPHCGGGVADSDQYCGHCGRWLLADAAESAKQTVRRCPYCREPVPETARACSNCGEWLEPGRGPRRRTRRGLPVWGAVLVGLLAAVLAAGATIFIVMDRWPAWEAVRLAGTPAPVTATEPVQMAPATEGVVAPTATEPPPTATRVRPTATPVPATGTSEPTTTDIVSPSPQPTATAILAETAQPTATTETPTEEPAEQPTGEPSPEPTAENPLPAVLPGRIAFPVFDPEEGTYDLYLANLDGSGLQMLKKEASQPALSPGGERIAFRSWRSDDRGVEVMNAIGGGEQRLSKFLEDSLPSWSPDGLKLVFFSRRESDRKSRVYQVEAIGGDDWELKRGVEPVWGEYPTWHASGSIVYRSTWPDQGLAVMNEDGSEGRMILSEGSATAPAVSPNGRFVALMSQQDGNWEVYRINVDGSGLLRLTNHEANDGLPTWAPDGSAIAFVSDRGGTWAMWAVAANGQGLRQLFTLPGSPDGLVHNQPDFSSRGWTEERISWGP